MFLGITGGIAAGKSTVVQYLTERGYPVIDCDKLAREAVQPGSACLPDIQQVFGAGVMLPDGGLNREKLAAEIFSCNGKRRRLENIIHPWVESKMMLQYHFAVSAGAKCVFADAPLLIEVGWQRKFDAIWLVICDDDTRLKRLMKRDGIDYEQAVARFAAQLPQSEKLKYADVVIDNSRTPEDTRAQLDKIVEKMEN